MVVLTIVMRPLEVIAALDRLAGWLAPLARPFRLTGMAVLDMVQISFVAPPSSLALMEDHGASDRHLGAAGVRVGRACLPALAGAYKEIAVRMALSAATV